MKTMFKKKNVILLPLLTLTIFLVSVLAMNGQEQLRDVFAQNIVIRVQVSHGGSGQVELCIDTEDYSEGCRNIRLDESHDPFDWNVHFEDPDEGDDFELCYQLEGDDSKNCSDYEFTGEDTQIIKLTLPGTGSGSGSKTGPREGQDGGEFLGNGTAEFSSNESLGLPEPSSSSTPPQQVTWKTFADRNGLFTIQYPSNWVPSPVSDPAGDVDFMAGYFKNDQSFANLNIFKFDAQSIYSSSKDSLDSLIAGETNLNPDFGLNQPAECTKYVLDGVPACSFIASYTDEQKVKLNYLGLRAVGSNGIEYGAHFIASTDLFNHFLPAVDQMIKSFRTKTSEVSQPQPEQPQPEQPQPEQPQPEQPQPEQPQPEQQTPFNLQNQSLFTYENFLNGQTYNIKYETTNGASIENIDYNSEGDPPSHTSLSISLSPSSSSGTLTISIPRDLMDCKYEGTDSDAPFNIFAPSSKHIANNDKERILSIDYTTSRAYPLDVSCP